MSLSEIRNVVLLFSNPIWSGASSVPSTVVRNITALSGQLAFEETLSNNLTTLTNTNAETLNGVIQGLLYVPTIPQNNPCAEDQYDLSIGLPRNVTRRANLPPTNYKLVALAPWFSKECTRAYLQAARYDPVRAFIFYRPNNSTNKPQDVDEPIWDLDDGGAWIHQNRFPIFAIPGRDGKNLIDKLSLYSGTIEEVPFGEQIIDAFGPNPKDYVRVWTELTMRDSKNIPALWTYFVIVLGALLFIITCVSAFMHFLQRQRRKSLVVRVKQGEVDLEAMGIARVKVPSDHVKTFPLFTYQSESDRSSNPSTPGSVRSSSRHSDRNISAVLSSSGRSRSSIAGSDCSTAATNYQPQCQICLEYFKNRVSVIRQLSCYHIYHPECIDEFLVWNSSLCPICQECMLPRGYCPRITNAMVRRERAMRRLRGTVDVELDSDSGKGKGKLFSKHILSDYFLSHSNSSEIPLTPVKSKSTKEVPPPKPTPSPAPRPDSTATSDAPPTQKSETPASDTPLNPEPAPRASSRAQAAQGESQDTVSALPRTERRGKSRRSRPRKLKLQAAPMKGPPLADYQPGGRKSPSELARARMKHLAQPIEDDNDRQLWRRAVNKIFPSLS